MVTNEHKAPLGRLTERRRRFVEEYLIDANAYQAAQRAGYAESTANKKAYLWVGKSREDCPANMRHLWDVVQKAKRERSERLKVDADYVLRKLVEMAEVPVRLAFDSKGNLKPVNEMPEALVELFSDLKTGRITNKLEVLKAIGQHVQVNAFRENVGVTGSFDLAAKLMEGRKITFGQNKSEND